MKNRPPKIGDLVRIKPGDINDLKGAPSGSKLGIVSEIPGIYCVVEWVDGFYSHIQRTSLEILS